LIVQPILDIYKCYETLGLEPGASLKEIKQAYRSLVLRYHPDKDPSKGDETKFKQISDAYQTLKHQYKTELKVTKKFNDIYPEESVLLYEQAQSLISKQKHAEAIIFYDKALEKLPGYINAWLKKGDALSYLKRFEEALFCYDKVIQINPELSDAWNLKGVCLSELKRHGEALDCFNKAISINPMHATAWNFQGVCFFILGMLEKSLECFDKATKIRPEFATAWYNKGGVLLKLDKKREAEKCYEKANKLRQ
jgi:tetratricopeptide (TPR) repeat protein